LKELVKKNLEKYAYQYIERSSVLYVKLGLSFVGQIDFSHKDKCIITDRLKGWNFLTGMIEMSLKSAMIYITIGLLINVLCCSFFEKELSYNFVYVMIGLVAYEIIWMAYYSIKSESFKIQVMNWIENEMLIGLSKQD
jgi:hypothetical protein